MTEERYYPGLEGVIAGETAISTIEGGLQYRGYAIMDLAQGASYEEVAYLLLHGELPNRIALERFRARLAASANLPEPVVKLIADTPAQAPAMDVLRTAVSALSAFDPDQADNSHDANVRKSERLLARIPLVIGARARLKQNKEPLDPRPRLSMAGNIVYLITGREPTPELERAMDVSLVLYAEHEFNASTFTARVVVSTLSDLYSAVSAAIGTLKGPLHGGASERVMEMLVRFRSADEAQKWVKEALARKERIMGFGHRVYKTGDPRAQILKDYCRTLAEQTRQTQWEEIAEVIEKEVTGQKGLPPNLDWPAGRLYYYMGLDIELYTPLFVASRVAGWCAHAIEQLDNNRLIRPRGRYIGPPIRPFVPLEERG